MSQDLTVDQFEPLVGQSVQLVLEGRNRTAKIAEVKKMTKHGDASRDPFSVLFVTDEEAPSAQQICQLDHADLGQFDVFLVPLGPQHGGMCYEAIFT